MNWNPNLFCHRNDRSVRKYSNKEKKMCFFTLYFIWMVIILIEFHIITFIPERIFKATHKIAHKFNKTKSTAKYEHIFFILNNWLLVWNIKFQWFCLFVCFFLNSNWRGNKTQFTNFQNSKLWESFAQATVASLSKEYICTELNKIKHKRNESNKP